MLAAHGPSLLRLAASYARHHAERDDLFQEIAMGIWRALPSFREECSERTFLFRVAHNRAISHLSRRRLELEDAEHVHLADKNPNPEQALLAGQQGQRLLDAVQRLPVPYRQVVTLALEGLSYREIGEVLGLTEGNVGARLTRARHILRGHL